MAGPLHYNVGRDAERQGIDDEGAAAGVGADQFPLGLDLVGADVALVGGDTNLFIDTSEFAQLLDVAVHRLIRVIRQGLALLDIHLPNGSVIHHIVRQYEWEGKAKKPRLPSRRASAPRLWPESREGDFRVGCI